jgi:peroxiredoxin
MSARERLGLSLIVLLTLGARAENFALLDHEGRFHELHRYADRRAIVLFVHGNGCPVVRSALPALHRLRAEHEPRGVAFLGLNANPQDTRSSVAAEAREFGIELPVLMDESQLVAGALGVERTAEAIAIDPAARFEIVFRGSLDGLDAHLAGRAAPPGARAPLGCLVSYLDRERTVSYADDVAPLLRRRCLDCHREGGVAPWVMRDFATLRGWSAMMREVVRTLRMPPGQIDPHVGSFRDARTLSPDEARQLVRWIEAGAPRGAGADPLADAPPAPAPEWPLGEPDLVLELPEQAIPATGVVDYRYLRIDVGNPEDRWVRAVDLRPSNPRVMHHALASRPPPDGSVWIEGVFAAYAPGRDPEALPAHTGRLLPAHATLRFQLHYTASGRPETDRPRLALYFHDARPTHALQVAAALNRDFSIPPFAPDHPVSASHRFERDVVLYSLTPHMHWRGKQVRFDVEHPDGARELLLSVPRYQFDWQRPHVLAEPRRLRAGTRIVVSGSFDNSAANPQNPDPSRSVGWGEQSFDEMFLGYLVYREGS